MSEFIVEHYDVHVLRHQAIHAALYELRIILEVKTLSRYVIPRCVQVHVLAQTLHVIHWLLILGESERIRCISKISRLFS